MSATNPSVDADRQWLLASIANVAESICGKNLDGVLRDYAQDAVLFDVKPPLQTQGVLAWRAMWENCLPVMPQNMTIERHDLSLHISGDLAAAHWIQSMKGVDRAPGGEMWMRVSVVYARRDGHWQIVHDHASMPFNPHTGQVVMSRNEAEQCAADYVCKTSV